MQFSDGIIKGYTKNKVLHDNFENETRQFIDPDIVIYINENYVISEMKYFYDHIEYTVTNVALRTSLNEKLKEFINFISYSDNLILHINYIILYI